MATPGAGTPVPVGEPAAEEGEGIRGRGGGILGGAPAGWGGGGGGGLVEWLWRLLGFFGGFETEGKKKICGKLRGGSGGGEGWMGTEGEEEVGVGVRVVWGS